MIKKLLLFAFSSVLSTLAISQTTTSATFTGGGQEVERLFGIIDTSDQTTCADTLLVSIPNGHYIYSVDVTYSIRAYGQVWTSDTRSYLECVTTNKNEATVAAGIIGANGIESFTRNSLLFTTGLAPNGQLKFVLHAFRNFGPGVCDTTNAKVVNNTFIVTVHHGVAPSCFPPSNLAVNWTMSNKAQVSFTSGGASTWQIEYGAVGFTLGSGTRVNAASNPFVLSGLTANTNYDFYVRDSCGLANVSVWSAKGTFKTLCAPTNAPFIENFDGTSWTVGGNTAPGTINSCWERSTTTTYWWKPRTGATPSNLTGPTGDHTSGTGKYMYTETSNGGTSTTLSSTPINLGSLTAPELTFYYHMYGQEINKLEVEINNGGAWAVVSTITGQQQTSNAAAWQQKIVNLTAYIGDTILIRFKATRNPGNNNRVDISIDDVNVQAGPACPQPSNLQVTNTASNSATLSWTSGGASAWQIEYGAPGFTLGSGTLVAASSSPFIVTGLTANTAYSFYVRDNCGVNGFSNPEGPATTTTLCGVKNAPYTENFDGTTWITGGNNAPGTIDPCWARTSTTTYWWKPRNGVTPSAQTGPIGDHTTGNGKYMYTETNNNGTTTTFTSPLINLATLTSPELSFYYHMYGLEINKLEVEVSTGGAWTVISTITGQQQTSNAAPWLEKIVSLTAYVGDTVQIRFVATRNTGNTNRVDISIDDVKVQQAPTCPAPTNFTAANVSSNSVNLAWTTGGAINWNIAFGPVGFAPGSTFTATNSNPFTLTGLTPGTNYHLYVRDSCAVGDVSVWVGPIAIFTNCAPISAPFTENFDGTSWVVGGNNVPGTIDPCWTRTSTTTYWWKPRTGGTPSNQTGPTGDHTSGTGKYMYTETSNNGTTTSLTSPLINVATLTSPELSFYYHMFGLEINKLEVEVSNGGAFTVVSTITGQQQTSNAAAWIEKIVSLSAYAGDTIQLRFTATRNTGNANRVDISIDDVDIHQAPACPKPSLVNTGTVTSTSVQVLWTTGGATSWQIEYGPKGFVSGAGTVVPAATNPFVVTGLTPNTAYDFYVRDNCIAGGFSNWAGPADDTTTCGIYPVPYAENFDGATWVVGGGGFAAGTVDPCWTRSATTQYWWRPGTGTTPTGNTGPTGDHTSGSGKYLYTESQTGSTHTEILTPQINLGTLAAPELRFWYHMYGVLITNLQLEINDGTGWAKLDSILPPQQTTQASAWLEKVVDLTSYAGDIIQIRFSGNKITGNTNTADISIDDITIKNAPTCPNPTNLSSTASTTTTVTLTWTSGGASNWQIEYGPVGFTLGAGTIVGASTNPFTVTGLSPSQNYAFYVRDSCGATDVSTWHGSITASTACGVVLAPYFENFDIGFTEGTGTLNDGSTISACWSRTPDSAYHWGGGSGPTTTAGTGPTADHTSGFGNYVYVEASLTPNGSVATLESPSINLTGIVAPEMHFWYNMWAQNGTMGSLRWEIFSNNAWTVLDSIKGTQGNAWQEKVVNLSAYANQTIKVRFRGLKSNGATPQQGDMAIDDLSIVAAPTCPDPSGLSAITQTNSSVQLSWTTGGASSWEIEYGPTGFAPGSGTMVTTTTNPHSITGLTQSTCYDFYVRDNCGPTDKSNWIGPVNACTFSCVNGCAYTLRLTDTFGDGWTGNGAGTTFHSINVTVGSNTTSYTLLDGTDSIINLNVCNGDTILLNFATNGNWSNECGVVLRDANNLVLFQDTGMAAGIIYSGSAACNNPCPTPIAAFSHTPTLLSVAFDASASVGTSLSYAWNFGDGTSGTGPIPTHVYGVDGLYVVRLIVTDICGQRDTLIQNITICQPLSASFTWTQNGQNVTFDASALVHATSYNWQFGDGITGIGSVVTHPYANTGTFAVKLTVTNLCGQTADTTVIITICVKPVAHWSYKITSSGASGMTVLFDGSTSLNATNYSWTFGDGGTNNVSAVPSHTYNVPGLFYIVRLIVTNGCGDSDTLTSSLASIGINEENVADWHVYPNPTQNHLFVEMPSTIHYDSYIARMVSPTGQLVLEELIQEEKTQLYTGNLANGIYILEILTNEAIVRKTIIIKH